LDPDDLEEWLERIEAEQEALKPSGEKRTGGLRLMYQPFNMQLKVNDIF
jgi:hypothetical protein